MGYGIIFDGVDAINKLERAQDIGKHQAGGAGLQHFVEYVNERTFPFIPFLSGLLEGSLYEIHHGSPDGSGFGYQEVYGLNPRYIAVDVWYSALDDYGNFDYAEFQHEEELHHPVRKAGKTPSRFYLSVGLYIASERMDDIIAGSLREVY